MEAGNGGGTATAGQRFQSAEVEALPGHGRTHAFSPAGTVKEDFRRTPADTGGRSGPAPPGRPSGG